MKRETLSLLLILTLASSTQILEAQTFKKKKKSTRRGFVVEQAMTPEEREKALRRRMVNPVRQVLNKFNLNIEKSLGYFSYQNLLNDVSIIRDPADENLFIVPIGQETGGVQPINAYNGWQTGFNPININSINPNSTIVQTDTADFAYRNYGRLNPWVFRLSFSLKKIDKGHFERTGEKIYLEEDLLRVGGGIGFGSIKFKRPYARQDVDPAIGDYTLQETRLKTTKMFGSVTYNFYTQGDFSALLDVYGGVWKTRGNVLDADAVTYDPFFNVGVMFQSTFSKYFKVYIRPSVEMRSYNLGNEFINTQHRFTVFSIDLGLLLKYPVYPRNKYKADMVQMEHVFNGKIYRGRPFYLKQNPRYGQRGVTRKESGSIFPIIKDKNLKKSNEKGGGKGN